MKFFSSLFFYVSIISLCVFTSCGDKDDDPDMQRLNDSFSDLFAYYIGYDASGDRHISSIYPLEKIDVSFDDNAHKADITFVNLASGRPGTFNYSNVVMKDLPFVADEHGVRTIVADNVDGGSMKMESVKIIYYPDKIVGDSIYHGISVRIKADKNNDMTVLSRNPICFGATSTLAKGATTPYISTRMFYMLNLNPESRTAAVRVCQSDFDPNMPAMDLDFTSSDPTSPTSVKMRMTLDLGTYKLSADTIIPTMNGRPYPGFKITDFSGTCDAGEDRMFISFDCGGRWHVDAELTGCYVRQPHPVKK